MASSPAGQQGTGDTKQPVWASGRQLPKVLPTPHLSTALQIRSQCSAWAGHLPAPQCLSWGRWGEISPVTKLGQWKFITGKFIWPAGFPSDQVGTKDFSSMWVGSHIAKPVALKIPAFRP